jgi:hypothetical protein
MYFVEPLCSADVCEPDRLLAKTPINVAQLHECRHQLMNRENVYVGLMFGSKALVQLIANPLIGPWTNKWVAEMPCTLIALQDRLYDTHVRRLLRHVLLDPAYVHLH